MNVHVGERVGPFVVVANESTIPARKRRVVVRCVVCERVSEMNERSLLDKRTEEQRACAKCRVYTTNGTWTKGWRAKMENAAIEANRLNKENADLRDEIDKVLRERDEARALVDELRGQYQYSVGLSMALEEREKAIRERDLALERLKNEINAANQARMAEERARESLDELDAAIYECLPSDYDDDSPLDCVEHAADRLRELAKERDEARREADRFRHGCTVEGDFVCPNEYAVSELTAERDEARAKYQWMVNRACDEKLDGYRELGAKCAQLEEERDEARADAERYLADLRRCASEPYERTRELEALQAEVERLRTEVASSLAMASAEADVLRGFGCMEDGDGPCGVCRECFYRHGYRRGAEAMREACAAALMADGLVLSRERAANVVRALPIPEET